MQLKGRCVGVIEIINKSGDKKFTEDDLQWLEMFATQAAIAIENARYLPEGPGRDPAPAATRSRRTRAITPSSARAPPSGRSWPSSERVGSHRLLGADAGRERRGQGAVRASRSTSRAARARRPFIRVNCAALPGGAAGERALRPRQGRLHRRDQDRRGRFELADGGTIFLDEIGDLPLRVQAKLLRVLQQKTFERVGSSDPITVDVRSSRPPTGTSSAGVSEGELPRRPLLPAQRPADHDPAPARAQGGHSRCSAHFFLARFSRETKKDDPRLLRRGDGAAARPTPGRATSASSRTPSSAPW